MVSVLAALQWHLPAPIGCTPLSLSEVGSWRETRAQSEVIGNTLRLELPEGEYHFSWQVQCSLQDALALKIVWEDDSFIQGSFVQDGYHAQEFSQESDQIMLIDVSATKASGELKMYIPQPTEIQMEVIPHAWQEAPVLSLSAMFPWTMLSSMGGAPFEVRAAQTTYLPPYSQTLPVSCQTMGDWFFPYREDGCFVASSQPVAVDRSSFGSMGINTQLYIARKGKTLVPLPEQTALRPDSKGQIIISEVMWAGSYFNGQARDLDQWIEFQNISDEPLNLQGVKIRGIKAVGDYSFNLGEVIPARGYFVLGSRARNNSSLSQAAHLVTDFVLPLAGKQIQLISSQGDLLDQTPSGAWPAGYQDVSSRTRASMQRRWPSLPGDDPVSWGHCQRDEGVDRCTALTKDLWKGSPGENLATPFQKNVL